MQRVSENRLVKNASYINGGWLPSNEKFEVSNPATGETIKIPAKTVLKFRIAKAAKDAVLG